MNDLELKTAALDLSNWIPMSELPKKYPHFTYGQLKTYFFRYQDVKPGLNRCCRTVGKKRYINHVLFAAWMAKELEE